MKEERRRRKLLLAMRALLSPTAVLAVCGVMAAVLILGGCSESSGGEEQSSLATPSSSEASSDDMGKESVSKQKGSGSVFRRKVVCEEGEYYKLAFTEIAVNINPMTEKMISYSRLLPDRKKFISCVKEGKVKEVFDLYLRERWEREGINVSPEEWEEAGAYKTETGVGVVLPAMHAAGGMSVWELSDED